MIISHTYSLRTKIIAVMVVLGIIFVALRLPGIDVPYYQDEWKNVHASASVSDAGKFFAHPPLMQILLIQGYTMFGPDYFRIFPLIFSVLSAFLLYAVLSRRGHRHAAFYSLGLLAICFYNILGSLMPDVDGSILPFFFLAALYAYDRYNESAGVVAVRWFVVFIGMLLLGFLTKLSFIIVVGVFMMDYVLQSGRIFDWRRIGIVSATFAAFALLCTTSLYLIAFLYPTFDMTIMFGHANQFAENVGRNWIQIIIQAVKAVFYTSPLILAPLLLVSVDVLKKSRIFLIYLAFGAIFYFGVFDFSRGVLDKYLMFAIIPLVAIAGLVYANVLTRKPSRKVFVWGGGIGLIISMFLFAVNFLPHEVLGLYPKTLWFSRVLHGQWAMLNPFNGGSGPMGFYVSFLFVALSFIVSIFVGLSAFFKKEWKVQMIFVIVCIGITYNLVMAEEYMFGKINGSAADVLQENVKFISMRPEIREIMTYNDIGARELSEIKKYAGRFYAAPQFEDGHRAKFAAYKGHYMVVDMPPIYDGFYSDFFEQCDILFETRSVNIIGRVYHCPLSS